MALSENKLTALSPARLLRRGFNSRPTLIERKAILCLVDILIALAACFGALWLWSFTRLEAFNLVYIQSHAQWLVSLVIIWIFLAWVFDLYHLQLVNKPTVAVFRLVGIASVVLFGYLLVFFTLAHQGILPRLPFLYFLALTTVGIAVWRWGYSEVWGRTVFRQRLLIIGSGWAGQTIAKAIQEYPHHFDILGFIDDDDTVPKTDIDGLPIFGTVTSLLDIARLHEADAVVCAIPHNLHPNAFQALLDGQASGLPVIQMATFYEELTGRVPVQHVRNDWLLPIEATNSQVSLAYHLFVRLFDVGFSLIGGLVFLFIGPIIAMLIKLDSAGPIFYRQIRSGKGGQPFELIKFRSMSTDAEKGTGAQWAVDNDPRVTRIGRFLRVSRLDELPQILNILRGDLHFIGPRPERPEFVEQLEQEIPFYRARLVMRPGLTGWAQVKYRYGSTVEDALMKLQYDLYYIKNRSIWLDLLIMVRTVVVVFTFKGT
ncbi:sugar transferase [Anaerolineales bacterium HSG25]|nr:sugar transferase [Anaerolineales bacterium HSG25]